MSGNISSPMRGHPVVKTGTTTVLPIERYIHRELDGTVKYTGPAELDTDEIHRSGHPKLDGTDTSAITYKKGNTRSGYQPLSRETMIFVLSHLFTRSHMTRHPLEQYDDVRTKKEDELQTASDTEIERLFYEHYTLEGTRIKR